MDNNNKGERRDMVLGVFTSKEHAEEAIAELKDAGYDADNISVVMKDDEDIVGRGAASGGVTGAVIGGVVGLVAGLAGFLVGGPIAAAAGLTGALATTAAGAATGGLTGVLVGMGVAKADADAYEKYVQSGGILVASPVKEEDESEAEAILERHGAEQIRTMPLYMEPRQGRKKIKLLS